MSEMEMFKTARVRGYDKDDVHEQVQRMNDEAAGRQAKLQKELDDKDEKIVELKKRMELMEAQHERMENQIRDKYQKYIDNYESIGKLVFEAQLRADAMVLDAKRKGEATIAEAEKQAQSRIDAVQTEIDEKLSDGKKKYVAVQEEMNEIVALINQAQKRFMSSYREVHRIISTMPSSLHEIEVATEVFPLQNQEEEIHLGDTQELELLDTFEGVEDLDELDQEERINEQLVSKIQAFLEDDIDEVLKTEKM